MPVLDEFEFDSVEKVDSNSCLAALREQSTEELLDDLLGRHEDDDLAPPLLNPEFLTHRED